MDVFGLVDYERAVPLNFKHPKTGAPMGIVWQVRHASCKAAEQYREQARANAIEAGQETDSAVDTFQAAGLCVIGWDWGEHTYKNGQVPDFSTDMAAEILRDVDWMFEQFVAKVADRGNFTNG